LLISSADKNPTLRTADKGTLISLIFFRLKALLDAEEKMYEQEFMDNLETPEQVREKMAQRLMDLKQRRE
jgi:hypothetical protein